MSGRVTWGMGVILALMLGCPSGATVSSEDKLSVEFERFLGVWFDIAHLPHPLQENCGSTRSLFTASGDDSVSFLFECKEPDHLWYSTGGEMVRHLEDRDHFVFEFENFLLEASLSLSFWVLAADWEAGWMALGNPEQGWFWLWARDPELDGDLRELILDDVEARGLYPGVRGELLYTDHS